MPACVDLTCSQILFVYPFYFEPAEFQRRSAAIQLAKWTGNGKELPVWRSEAFSTEFFLPHVANYLNPEDESSATARFWMMAGGALQSQRGGLGMGKNHANLNWQLVYPKGRLPFDVERLDLALFRVGVGMLTLHVKVKASSDQVNLWYDCLHYFRFSAGQRCVKVMAQKNKPHHPEIEAKENAPFFPTIAGGSELHPLGEGLLNDLIGGILNTGSLSDAGHRWWQDAYVPGQLLPFASLYIDDLNEQEIAILVYRARNHFHYAEEIDPAASDLSLDHPSLISYAQNQWFYFSLDGGGYISCNGKKGNFIRTVFPGHFVKQYFVLFLLALHQRFKLMKLLDQVAEKWPTGVNPDNIEPYEKAFEEIRNQMLLFTARGYFAQVMQRSNHHRCYLKWQEIFQLERLFQEINMEIRYMYECLQSQHNQRQQALGEEQRRQSEELENQLNTIAWLIGIPALALTYLQAIGGGDWLVALIYLLGGLTIGFVFRGILGTFGSRRKRKSSK